MTKRGALCGAALLVVGLVGLAGCWADFPASRFGDDSGRDQVLDVPPGSERAADLDDTDSTTDGALGDTTRDASVDLPDGPRGDTTRDGQPPDSTVDASVDSTPADTSVDSGPCPGLVCPLGCNAAVSRCNRLGPSNFDVRPIYDQLTATTTFSSSNGRIDTNSGEVRDGPTVLRAAGDPGTVKNGIYWGTVNQASGYPVISVFGFKTLTVSSGAVITIGGPRAALLYVAGAVSVAGAIRAPAVGRLAGPGGYAGGTVNNDGQSCFNGEGREGHNSGDRESGGGGGGRRASGGNGGGTTAGSNLSGGSGGAANGNQTLVPLYGGCGGGGGDEVSGSAGAGGGGGGALQISADGALVVPGEISAQGAGGGRAPNNQAGGGGGSGGAILLEGHSINVSGIVAANGGGGGGGGGGSTSGQSGRASVNRANGGNAGSSGSGGGRGGSRINDSGESAGSASYNGGGGGGSAGRVRFNASSITAGANDVSPSASTSGNVNVF